ncbi:MAG: 5-formyltetrahydrofolate cyclo-ligase [Betaproteobacteria bacterium RBG_16_64_18]|nr:MAG: 5-formyltetrahydrofolate cyclo-ligase [Betaproteobacteria bacterium RBG_16_64_18]OGA07144.1 MAG: 5-formyltetrahydrofolate cyclo-ligase [Betaproteobacteria bacterium RIFCSPLOWO2_02_FULL_65_20]OGA36666.1 MAG: 5-formyltetrahydrofolate cyclo-ligase [Betaproteobacteria bacterium RIFCSPLOWO2_12_FULL_65_110]
MTPQEIQAWRKALRQELIEKRAALPRDALEEYRHRIDAHLLRAFPDLAHGVVAFCWPYRNEYDARHLLADLRRRGAMTALPAIVAPRTPLVFREWHPGVTLEAGPLGIPFPPDSPQVQPDSVLLPVVAFDAAGYRLGYGGSYFDRTLAVIERRPRVIAIGYEFMFIETIHPQPHDVPVDYVVTERGIYVRRPQSGLRFLETQGYSSPPCYAAEIAPDYFGESPPPKPGP